MKLFPLRKKEIEVVCVCVCEREREIIMREKERESVRVNVCVRIREREGEREREREKERKAFFGKKHNSLFNVIRGLGGSSENGGKYCVCSVRIKNLVEFEFFLYTVKAA